MSFNNECPFCGEVGYDLLGLKSHLQFCDDFQSVPSIKTFYQGFSIAETDAEIVRRERDAARAEVERMKANLLNEHESTWLIEQNQWSVQYNSYHQSWTVQRHGQVVGAIGRGNTLSEAVAQAAAHQNEETAANLSDTSAE